MNAAATTVICTYQVRAEKEDEFRELLSRHWPTLDGLGLVRGDGARVFRGEHDGGSPFYVEIFEWKDAEAPGVAHRTPEVMAIWEPMGALVEERDGRPSMEFPHVEPLQL